MKPRNWLEWIIPGLCALVFCLILWALIHTAIYGDGIPNCGLCGQKMYRNEIDYYITTTTHVGDVPITTLTPVFKAIPHRCPAQR